MKFVRINDQLYINVLHIVSIVMWPDDGQKPGLNVNLVDGRCHSVTGDVEIERVQREILAAS